MISCLFPGFTAYISTVHGIYIPPGPVKYCTVAVFFSFWAILNSTLLVTSMTFDRFYSILRPHKASVVNTVKRASFTIICVSTFSLLFNVPHLFLTSHSGWSCFPYGAASGSVLGDIHYWFSFLVNFILPFISLLMMNSFIIHSLRRRLEFVRNNISESRMNNSEKQVFAILLLVTFTFLILTTPGYCFFLYILLFDFTSSPSRYAGYHFFFHTAQKMAYTNHGINFFLYVMSGSKFRSDLRTLFWFLKKKEPERRGNRSEIYSLSSGHSLWGTFWWFKKKPFCFLIENALHEKQSIQSCVLIILQDVGVIFFYLKKGGGRFVFFLQQLCPSFGTNCLFLGSFALRVAICSSKRFHRSECFPAVFLPKSKCLKLICPCQRVETQKRYSHPKFVEKTWSCLQAILQVRVAGLPVDADSEEQKPSWGFRDFHTGTVFCNSMPDKQMWWKLPHSKTNWYNFIASKNNGKSIIHLQIDNSFLLHKALPGCKKTCT